MQEQVIGSHYCFLEQYLEKPVWHFDVIGKYLSLIAGVHFLKILTAPELG